MSTFKDTNRIVVVAMLQLANMNHRFIILDARSRLDEGNGDGHRVLDPSLVYCRHNATLGPLCQSYERELRMTDSSFVIYMRMEPSLFDETLNRVGPESKRVTPRKAVGPDVKLARTTRA